MLLKKNNKLIVIFIFCIIIFILKLVISKYISPVVKITYEFDFQKFLIFTFLLSIIIHFVKILAIYGVIKASFFVSDIKPSISLFNAIVLAQLLRILIIDGLKIYTFYSLGSQMTLEQFKTVESSYSFYEIFHFNIIDFKYLINFIDIFDFIYIYAIMLMFSIYEKFDIKMCLKVILLPYILALFLLAIVKTFMSL